MFYENKIGFMDTILEDNVKACLVCVKVLRSTHKFDPITSINFEGSDFRYITYLNCDMAENFGIKYLLN